MFDVEIMQRQIQSLEKRITDIGNSLCIDKLESELSSLQAETMKQEFWNDTENSSKVLTKITDLKKKTLSFRTIEEEVKTISEMLELILIEPDKEIETEITKNIK